MTPTDLIADLRSRINPTYANQLGTESYERRLCVEALEAQAAEIERMRNRIERLRGSLKTASGWCFDMTDDDPERIATAVDWMTRADLLLKWAGDMESTNS